MRKSLEALSIVALLCIWGITAYAILGPHPLPAVIPTHFDLAGRPNGWGTPAMLWLTPGIATFVYALTTLVQRIPSAFHYPVRVTAQNRQRVQAAALSMVAWLKAEIVCLFTWIQIQTVHSAQLGQGKLSPFLVPLCIVGIFATIGWHFAAMRRAAR